MITPLVNKEDVDEAFAVFSQSVTTGGQQVKCIIGYQGGSELVTLTWYAEREIWIYLEPERLENRFWCAFGTANPITNSMVSITCEINPPHSGVNRQCAGLFIRDSTGAVHLAHSGKIGGGRTGVGKTAFLNSRDQNDVVPVRFPDKRDYEYIVIGCIDDKDFLDELARFVHGIARFKDNVKMPDVNLSLEAIADAKCVFVFHIETFDAEVLKMGKTGSA